VAARGHRARPILVPLLSPRPRYLPPRRDILLKLWGGLFQPNFGGNPCQVAAALTDSVNANDVPYLREFPYPAASSWREHPDAFDCQAFT